MSGPSPVEAVATVDVPEEFTCIITHKLMRDAVVDSEGNSYDKYAIEEWLEKNATSPHTRAPLRKTQLTPNRVLRGMIDKWRKEHPVDTESHIDPQAAVDGVDPDSTPDVTTKALAKLSKHAAYVTIRTPVAPTASLQTEAAVPKDRLPAAIVCCVDTSGSMCSQAKVKDDIGNFECTGLTQLDLVKHAIRVVLASMTECDSLGLVSFNCTASVNVPLLPMTKENKERVSTTLAQLKPAGRTNIWDGLFKGLEQLREADCPGNANLMLFTDGRPTVQPPRGHVEMLHRYRDEHQVLPCAVNTYGFGYELDSALLSELASEGCGTYAFIPDASLLGTVFVHSIANQLAKCGRDIIVNVEEREGLKLADDCVVGGYQHTRTTWGVTTNLGSAQYGQSRDAVFRVKAPATTLDCITASWYNLEKRERETLEVVSLQLDGEGAMPEKRDVAELHLTRLTCTEAIAKAHKFGNAPDTAQRFKEAITTCKTGSAFAYPEVADIVKDMEGQVTEALEQQAFNKWGQHFLPSLMGAHLMQQCNNFKDPGVQHYGGPLFSAIRDMCDKAFLEIPPPEVPQRYAAPEPNQNGRRGNAGAPAQAAPRPRMQKYLNRGGGCFAGDCHVHVVSSEGSATLTRVDAVQKGDTVLAHDGTAQTVVCVVRTAVPSGRIEMRRFADSGLTLTPYHPMLVGGEWVFPTDAAQAETVMLEASYVYDYVLSGVHAVQVNGVSCVTLGHGIETGAARHAYFGSAAVVDDLARMEGYAAGVVVLTPDSFARNSTSHLVQGLVQPTAVTVSA